MGHTAYGIGHEATYAIRLEPSTLNITSEVWLYYILKHTDDNTI